MEKVIVINSEFMGSGSLELGARLMNVFLHRVMLAPVRPDAMILYNSAVKLAVDGTATAEALSEMMSSGVQILACGTCIEFYQIGDKLKGARQSNMEEITGILFQAKTVITL